MLFSKCLRAKIYCNMNVHFDPQGCQTLLLKERELFFYLWAPGLLILLIQRFFFSFMFAYAKTLDLVDKKKLIY